MQKFLCKIGRALQREQTNALILAAWGLYLVALLGGKLQGNAVYTLRQCVTFGFFVLGAGLEYSLGDIDLCFMAQASLSTVWLGLLYQHGMPLPWALVCMALSQIIMGALRGALAATLHIPMTVLSFILAVILSNLYPANDVILMNVWGNRPYTTAVWGVMAGVFLLCAIGLQCFWKRTYWGKYCLAIGEDRQYNRNDVEKTGINVVLVTAVTYALAAVFFAVGTYTLLLSAGYCSSSRNAEYLYQGIAAAGLAGGMYRRYKNGASGLVLATVTMVVLRQTFMALKIDKCLIIVEGLVILLTIWNKDGEKLMQK